MISGLSPELRALCELASHEQDSGKLLELANRISDALENAEQEKKEAKKSNGSSVTSTAA